MLDFHQIDPTAKYFPPQLMEKLEFIKKYPLTLIEAPSGFGKTTILEHFFNTRVSPAIPHMKYDFELDYGSVGWNSVCEQLSKIDETCAKKLNAIGPPEEDNLAELSQAIRELQCTEETYLWLDNYKFWDIDCLGAFLNILTRHGGRGLHIVVSTQPLSEECWRQLIRNGSFWHLQGEDFTFTIENTEAYFQEVGLTLPQPLIREVYDLTEGWVMALCLQVMSYVTKGNFERGSMDDLMERVFWEKLGEPDRDFLLQISIFPSFTLSQAVTLSGASSETIDQLLRGKRYFIHFDPERRCFYPHLQLRQFLKFHFRQLPPEKQKQIYLKGGEAAEQSQDRKNTLRFYYLAGEWERLLSLPLTSYDIADVTAEETKPMIIDILENTPEAIMLRHPQAMIPMAFALFFMGENERLLKMHEKIEDIIQRSDLCQKEKDSLRGEIKLLLSFLQYNRISDMSAYHREALKLLDGPSKLISLQSTWTFGSPSILCLYWRESGKLAEELEEMDTCMPIYYKLTQGHGSGAEQIMRAEALFMQGKPDEALPLCYQALFTANSHRQNSIYFCGLFLLCRAALQMQDAEQFEITRKTMREWGAVNTEDLCRHSLELADGYLSLLLGEPEEVAAWISQGAITEKRLVIMTHPFAYILYGRCLLERKEYHKLLGVSEHFIGISSIFPNLLPQVYAHIYCAEALDAIGKEEDAANRLQIAMNIAVPDQIYLPFAENYAGLQNLFAHLSVSQNMLDEIERLAKAYEISREEAENSGFSPREEDILDLVKQNMTNKEIGERLYLSPNTIRNILSGMLRKKGLSSREQLKNI